MIVAVDDGEHLLIELIEELVHHVGEVEFAAQKVAFELHEQLAEHVRVLLVNHSVGLLEHLVEAVSGLREQRLEEFWKWKKKHLINKRNVETIKSRYRTLDELHSLFEHSIGSNRISIANTNRCDNKQ